MSRHHGRRDEQILPATKPTTSRERAAAVIRSLVDDAELLLQILGLANDPGSKASVARYVNGNRRPGFTVAAERPGWTEPGRG